MKVRRNFLPSILTILNLFAGFLALLQISRGHYITAVELMIAALIFDGLDGKIARLTHQTSDFGIEFDSLCDMVSFCLVPAVLIHEIFVSELGLIGGLISFFPLLFGGVRLARFNLQDGTGKKSYFIGMPTPTSALTIGSYVWFSHKVLGNYGNPKIILPLVVVLSFLMVSNIRFSTALQLSLRKSFLNIFKIGLALIMIAGILVFNGYVIFPLMMIYIITHLLQWLIGYDEPRVHLARRKAH